MMEVFCFGLISGVLITMFVFGVYDQGRKDERRNGSTRMNTDEFSKLKKTWR